MSTPYDAFKDMTKDRTIKALIGITKEDFYVLLPVFTIAHDQVQRERFERGEIKQMPSGGPSGNLNSMEKKLFFILFYLKTYCTFDVLGTHFDFGAGNAHGHVIRLLPVLQRALSELGILPRQDIQSVAELRELIGSTLEIAIDVVECPVVRPTDDEAQEEYYSGKKKQHTIKSLIISNLSKYILFVSFFSAGKNHDYKMMKELFDPNKSWFELYDIYLDLGFLGAADDYSNQGHIHLPHKKKRKSKKNPSPSLTKKQKAENKKLAAIRVVVEHAIGGMKHFHCLAYRIRNHTHSILLELHHL